MDRHVRLMRGAWKSALPALLALIAVLPCRGDEEARQALAALRSRIAALGAGYRIEFVVGEGDDRIEGSCLVRGDDFEVKLPGGRLLGNGRLRYEVNETDREVTIDRTEASERGNILSDPTRAFDLLDTGYDARSAGRREYGGRMCRVVELTPGEGAKGSSDEGMTLYIDERSGLPAGVVYRFGGQQVAVTLVSFRAEQLDADYFRFDAGDYSGYEIIDFSRR